MELEHLGLAKASAVVDGTVIRQPKAYPVYDGDYQDALAVIRDWLGTIENLQVVGRNGMHRYNNQDHSMLTAMLAVENIFGAKNDLWSVNVERSYHEEFEVAADIKDAIQVAATGRPGRGCRGRHRANCQESRPGFRSGQRAGRPHDRGVRFHGRPVRLGHRSGP